MFVRLSYNLREDFPPEKCRNTNRLNIRQVDYIGKAGKLNNRFEIRLTSHTGTHIDAPYHFNGNGKRIVDFSIENYVYSRPAVLDISKGDEELIEASELIPFAERISKCDLLMLRTHFSKHRFRDPLRYATKNPGISVDAANYLMENFSNIKAVAIDAISIEFEGNFDHEFKAHRALLGEESHPVILIEDVNLEFDLSSISRVIVLPLFIEGIDGSPCSIIAELK